ncbi:hypothetical protein [Sphingobacterium hungaricum]|uniref:DUF559 domain-containing protein n=1 Tax=Sphingobacterium hungaricum TaxID=2082723 RepID=A0A928UWE2_9SPHI|nr:hypothetical protein [Sphingobacterium hungaricum]MBE8712535.1 hypothetical protein [Sphingobacterium hungaricum]
MAKWGRPGQGKSIVKEIIDKGFIRIGDRFFHPSTAEAKSRLTPKKKRSKINRTGDINDTRNIRNKENHQDAFIRLIKLELDLEVWPEFYFCTERQFRIDYAIPELKIAIEQEGGIWMKGNSGHSSGSGIARDMEKNNLLVEKGWRLIRRQPNEMLSISTLCVIRKALQ